MQVAFLNPADGADAFFGTMVTCMRRAAASLGIELEVVEGGRSRERMRDQARALVARTAVPEYLLLVNEEGLAVEVLPLADQRGIKTLVFNEGLMVPDRQALGNPGERVKSWLGEMVPDDRTAGYQLGTALLSAARRRAGGAGRIGIVGLGGSFTSSSLLRINGLRQAVSETPDAILHEVVPANWEIERARVETRELLTRHPDVTAIWSASDHMALGAAEALRALGKTPGADVFLGGIDWAPFAFDEIRRGTFTASVGGHFLDGAWALVLLYDHHRRPSGPIHAKSQLALATRDNVDTYERVASRCNGIDFRRFSRVENPELQSYPFSVETILSAS
jgi:ABC-type sugar transport system substrate-binding protein